MLLFAVAHGLHLLDGLYAVRSPEFPGCEARHARIEVAREQFADVLRERLLKMHETGEVRGLYTYEELGSSFAARCTTQIPAPDRMPGSFDRVMAVRAKLPPGVAERFKPGGCGSAGRSPAGSIRIISGASSRAEKRGTGRAGAGYLWPGKREARTARSIGATRGGSGSASGTRSSLILGKHRDLRRAGA